MSAGPLAALLAKRSSLVLDGAIGTELERRGVDTGLPLWSARALLDAPAVLMRIHNDYLSAGADILTTDTFRTTRRMILRAGMKDRSQELTLRAVDLAHAARAAYPQRSILIAGSLGPLEDCYKPDLVPSVPELQEEHAEHAQQLAEAGVDFLLLETFGTVREAALACKAAVATGKEVVISFLCTAKGMLYSGESLNEAVTATLPFRPNGYSLNCVPARSMSIPLAALNRILAKHQIEASVGTDDPSTVARRNIGHDGSVRNVHGGIIRRSRKSKDGATSASGQHAEPCIGVYGNVGRPGEELSDTLVLDVGPEEYGRLAQEWVRHGARIVGGCCGTTPEHIAAVSRALS